MTGIRTLAGVVLAAGLLGAFAAPAQGQVFHRPRCSDPDCLPELFRLAVERMTLTEGPFASDRDERDLLELKGRIERELEATPADPALWLALAEAESGLGDPIRSMSAATKALELGADSALALRARAAACMRMAGGEFEGATLYLETLARMTREARPRFLADVMPLLTPNEMDWARSADLETVRRWMRDYWEHRAALAGVRVEDRLAEHMRRVSLASRRYAPAGTGSGAVGEADVLRSPELNMLAYDDRGLVYVRRGPPLRELRVAGGGMSSELPTMTWLYGGVDGSVDAFHFARGSASGSGYRLVTAPPCDPAFMTAAYVSVEQGWVLTTAGTSAERTRTAMSCFNDDAFTLRANASLNDIALRRETMRALAVESPREPFRRALPAYFDHYMFRGPDNTTEVVTPVVVPVESGETQSIELLVTFADRGGGVIRREATSSTARAAVRQSIVSEGEGWGVAYARTLVEPADDAEFRVVVRDAVDAERGGMWGGPVVVRSYDGYGLKMSDLVVSGSGPATWARGATRLFLLPARSFTPGTNAVIFYELYDLEPGSSYTTELTLSPEKEGLGARIWRALTGPDDPSIRFESQVPETAGATLQELRSLRLPEEEGRYTLTVRITGTRGQVAESTREVVVSKDAAQPSGSAPSPSGPQAIPTGEE